MARMSDRLPKRFPIGSKYVVEGQGPLVRRYVEFLDGHKIMLAPRAAATCDGAQVHAGRAHRPAHQQRH